MKRKLSTLLIALVSLVALIFVSQNLTANTTKAATNSDPIFFVPGSYSNADSWDEMFTELDPNQTHPVVKLEVNSNGGVTRVNVRNGQAGERPLVSVSFEDILWNDQAVYENANGLNQAIKYYQSQNSFKHADIIGQSNGGNVITRYMEQDPSSMFNTFISVGTPYNMRAGNGDPATSLLLSQIAGADRLNPNMHVYNCIGCDGSDLTTDGVVSRDSAEAGKNIFPNHVASFQFLYLHGHDALHTQQAECPSMARIISQYINL